ncbi:MAG: hypothetical protein OXB86_06960 [Bdellovibrionales bacterium]|nr:hypothetical protein [Bdellovibrionales bacterium]
MSTNLIQMRLSAALWQNAGLNWLVIKGVSIFSYEEPENFKPEEV